MDTLPLIKHGLSIAIKQSANTILAPYVGAGVQLNFLNSYFVNNCSKLCAVSTTD